MGERSKIEWTDSTWNPVTGCTKVSTGCDHCYAHALAHQRLADTYRKRLPVVDAPENLADPFAVRLWPERLSQPGRWPDARMIFVNSMSDLFHVDVPEKYIREIFRVMLDVDRHTYQVLTKRPGRAVRFFNRNRDLFPGGEIPAHIWMGTSVEDQQVDYRVHQLVTLPAALRFLSCEPLIGPLSLALDGIHWLIAGGESGIGYRKLDLSWVRDLREQCVSAGVPFFFKQVGGRTPKAGGRLLDGETWDQWPSVADKRATAELTPI
jgi:protein gp37